MNPSTSRTATGSFRPDSPSRVRASRRRSVDVRSTEKTAAASVAASTDPSSSPSSVERSNSQAATNPVSSAVRIVPTNARLTAGRSTGPTSLQPDGEAALEQDQRQRDDPDPAGHLVVVELDPARAVRADQHPGSEHQHQGRHAEARSEQRGGEPGGQQRAADEDQLAVGHAGPVTMAADRGTIAGASRPSRARRGAGGVRGRLVPDVVHRAPRSLPRGDVVRRRVPPTEGR